MSSEEPGSYRTTDDPTNSKIENEEGKNIVPRPTIRKFALQSEPYRPRSVSADSAAVEGEEDSSRPCLKMMSCRTCLKMMSWRPRPKMSFMQEEDPFIKLQIDDPTVSDNNQTKNGGSEGGERAEPDWVIIMKEKLSIKPSCCIYRVPQAFHDGNEKACVPQIVSIGPFHHGKQSLKPMEEYKLWYQQLLLPRNGGFMCLKRLLDIVKSLEKKARQHYSETIDLDSNAFAEMMLRDCCFLIALFLKKGKFIRVKDDPIFKMRWVMPALRRDLLMLENQVPFFILQTLFDHINTQVAYRGPSLDELALHFFNDYRLNLDMSLKHDEKEKTLHLLHLFYISSIPEQLRKKSKWHQRPLTPINSITKLQAAGLKLRKRKGKGFLDIRFEDNEILEIPPLEVHDITCSQLLNLVAFEQCYCGVPTLITAYVFFMDCLIDSPEDVGILRQDGIINNWLGTNEKVANFFNKLWSTAVVIQIDGGYECHLFKVFCDVNEYCSRKWPGWREKLMSKYFMSPWATISLVGAIFLLILTVAQTIISFVAYYDPPSS